MSTFADAITVEELDRDPYPIYARMRREAPVCFVPAVGLWFVTRWADVEHAATHVDLFVSRVEPSPLARAMGGDSILLLDGEPQKRLRAMLDPSLRPRVVEATTPEIVIPIVEELLDDFAGAQRGRADERVLRACLRPLARSRARSRASGRRHLATLVPRTGPGSDQLRGRCRQVGDLGRDGARDRRRARTGARAPVGRARRQHDRRHAPARRGHTGRAGGADPADAEGDPARRHAGAGTCGRLDASPACSSRDTPKRSRQILPVSSTTRSKRGCAGSPRSAPQTRRATTETVLGGITVPEGANVGVLVSSANRDEAVWGDTADRFDLFRPRRNHAAFGFGPHFCSGHHFSRVQMRIAIQKLFERLPGLRLDADRPPLFNGWEFRAPQHLHVRWGP